MVLLLGFPLPAHGDSSWMRVIQHTDITADLDGLTDIVISGDSLVLSFWGGQRLLVLSAGREDVQPSWTCSEVNTSVSINPALNLLGGAVVRQGEENVVYLSQAGKVYRLNVVSLALAEVADLEVPGLTRLACTPLGLLYGIELPYIRKAATDVPVWEINKKGSARSFRYVLPEGLRGKTGFIAGMHADDGGLYLLALSDYRLWLAKWASGKPQTGRAYVVCSYIGNIVEGMRSKVWRLDAQRLLIYCGNKVYIVAEERLDRPRPADYAMVILNDENLSDAFVSYDSDTGALYVIPTSGSDAGKVLWRRLYE